MDHITVKKIGKYFRTNGCRKWRNRFKIEKFVVLADILNSRQTTAGTAEKLANQGKVIRGGISRIYLSLSNEWKPCHQAINSRSRNLRMALEKYFRFHWNCKQLRVETRSSMSNCETYFPIFSETIHTDLKIFSQCGLRKCR